MSKFGRTTVTGFEELRKKLDMLSRSAAGKIMRPAVAAGAKIALKAMKDATPTRTKLLKKSEARKAKTYRASGVTLAIIGPRTGMRIQVGIKTKGKNKGQPKFKDPTKYVHLVELGTAHSQAVHMMKRAIETPAVNGAVVSTAASKLQELASK